MSLSFSAPRIEYEAIEAEVENLTSEEKDAIRGDLDGERPAITETEEMIQHALKELEDSIASINPREAYETAQVICPEYANSREFRLLFLRCERYDCKGAAQRIINYWDNKVEVWGADKAFRRLTLDDFDDEDQTALERGGFKILPGPDNAGRGILFSHLACWEGRRTHRNSMLRQVWYVAEAALEDVNLQRNGMLLIAYNGMPSYDHTKHDYKLHRKLVYMGRYCLPVRIVAIHHIIPSALLKLIAENLIYWFGLEWRARYRQHSGIKDEYIESFANYGIEHTMLPQVLGGELEFDYGEWLVDRRVRNR